MWIPALLAEELGPVAVQDSGRTAALDAIAAMRPLEIVEAQPGLQIRVEVRGGGVEAVAEGDAVVLMQAGALEGIRQVSDNPAFASVSPIRKPARICP